MSYGYITAVDAGVLEAVLQTFKGRPVRFVELGTYQGGTAVGVRDFCAAQNSPLEYWAVDASAYCGPGPFPGCHYIIGKTDEVSDRVPNECDMILVDACHCLTHVVLDAVNYGSKVKPGGYMLFHDTAPDVQDVQTNTWVHQDKPVYRTNVLEAFKFLGWPNARWELFKQDYDPTALLGGRRYGGMAAFRKTI